MYAAKLSEKVIVLFSFVGICICLCGCETMRVGGKGQVGPVRGSGDIVIDVPNKDK
ncbi:MAG: hypothetical protein JW869_03810 [Candidatus Omnitrophica bacterium]|nr:hypothetical protein [Candidatus Omnitrophota bacterium]